ncbi:hypothetical protein B0T26DRAFT_679612 [Lasiosphaeria miniovina]|uniref:Uncharacterized protein n=1 Tax=Lasiosphaeria miniovina TaxID=1954250 RepID=A0AA40A6W0_9PEZI|nr:uncharacterized protein B0T26DRAFT_679612 [Lasiosphaeria miniovina]KAK0710322.1 hypothetical protein B0T26DRAFT_679612 [Lasiosphaeria miniovina]
MPCFGWFCIPLVQRANVQLLTAIRAHPTFSSFQTPVAGTKYVFVQYEVPYNSSDVDKNLLVSDPGVWVYRIGAIGSGYLHVRCTVLHVQTSSDGQHARTGTCYDFADAQGTVKKSEAKVSPWTFNDHMRADGSGSGYVFYCTTSEIVAAIAALGYVNSNPIYTLDNNNCSKFAHYLANAINDTLNSRLGRRI